MTFSNHIFWLTLPHRKAQVFPESLHLDQDAAQQKAGRKVPAWPGGRCLISRPQELQGFPYVEDMSSSGLPVSGSGLSSASCAAWDLQISVGLGAKRRLN